MEMLLPKTLSRRSRVGTEGARSAAMLIVAFCMAIGPSPLLAQDARSDSAAVARAVESFHGAMQAADSAAVLQWLAPDAVILESGVLETVEEYRSHHLASDIRFARDVAITRESIRIVVRGDVAWSISVSSASGTFRERVIDSTGAELIVLSREPDGWRIQAIHWSSRSRAP